jgi:diguanylate cyclase (GGDEF)-like protein
VLTQLFNRRAGEQLLDIMLTTASNTQSQLALLLIDLDGFKSINDNHGHDAGDKVLIEVARRMQSVVRKEDILIRMGGDEFVIAFLIKDGSRDEINLIVNKLQKQLNTAVDLDLNRTVTVGASIGIALFPQDGEDMETLMANADNAMYQIKKKRKAPLSFLASIRSAE